MNFDKLAEVCRVLDIDPPNPDMESAERILERVSIAVVDWNTDIEERLQKLESLIPI